MIKLNILNMKNFLETVNTCDGAINLLYPDQKKKNMNKQYHLQNDLMQEYKQNHNYLTLTLDIPNPKDFMNIVCYYAGDC